MHNTWATLRHLGRIRLDNYVPYMKWRFSPNSEPDSWSIDLRKDDEGPYGTTVASVKIRKLTPNIYLSEKLYVHPDYRGKGLSKKLFNVEWAFVSRVLQGSILQAMVRDDNKTQVERLKKLGWVRTTRYTDEDCFEASVWFYSSYGFVQPLKQDIPSVQA